MCEHLFLYCRIRLEELLCDAEHDVLAIAKFSLLYSYVVVKHSSFITANS